MKKILFLLILSFFTCLTFAQERNFRLVKPATENPTKEKRKAVVVGMSDYGGDRSLNNTLNDAKDMADVLTKLGFEVTLLTNNDQQTLENNLNTWYNTIKDNDMAIFYYTGHGMEVSGNNYLIPIDFPANATESDIKYKTLSVNQVLDNMDEKHVGFKLLILDACRDNPFTKSWSRGSGEKGLAQMAAPVGTFIAFAASPGATAADGGNYNLKNGVFTYFLKQEILKEGISIDRIFTNVSKDVSNLTNSRQIPFRNSSLTETFFFIPRGNDNPAPSISTPISQAITVTGINLNKTSTTLIIGNSETLAAVVSPSNATNTSVTWTSSNPSVATINSSGQIKAIAAGSVAIIATTIDGGRTAICNVTVSTPVENSFANYTEAKNNYNIEMIAVQGGTFTMGSTPEQGRFSQGDEKPAHQVTVSDFYIGKYEVTQAQWKAVMGTNPSYSVGDNLPEDNVSWNEVQEFIRQLNIRTGKRYRLPTEAEWEYAARGGNKSQVYKYSGSNNIDDVAWYVGNSGNKIHPVGTKLPNELGIYDMSGNMSEWCNDRYGNYYSSSQIDPQGSISGSDRVVRGGCMTYQDWQVRVAFRQSFEPTGNTARCGFRLACSAK